jgi:hypothetical protein
LFFSITPIPSRSSAHECTSTILLFLLTTATT